MSKNYVQTEIELSSEKEGILFPGYLTIVAATLLAYMLCISDYLAATGKTDLNQGVVSTADIRAHDAVGGGQDVPTGGAIVDRHQLRLTHEHDHHRGDKAESLVDAH